MLTTRVHCDSAPLAAPSPVSGQAVCPERACGPTAVRSCIYWRQSELHPCFSTRVLHLVRVKQLHYTIGAHLVTLIVTCSAVCAHRYSHAHTHMYKPRMSTKPDIVSVESVHNGAESGCSRQALLTAQSTHPTRLNSIIIAEEQGRTHQHRCTNKCITHTHPTSAWGEYLHVSL